MSTRVRPELLQRLLVALLPALLSAPRFWNGFVFDDVYMILRGGFIHDLRNLPRAFSAHAMAASSLEALFAEAPLDTYRPLSIATFFWDSLLSGHQPWSYHLTNTLLHASCCVLVLELLRRLCPRASASLLVSVALCFGLAPVLSEAHVFINGRSDVLLGLFCCAAVLSQRSALQPVQSARACASGLLALCALLSKESAVLMLPFIVLAPTASPAPWTRRAKLALPHLAAFLIYLSLRGHALHGMKTHASSQHILLALANVPLLWLDAFVHYLLPLPYTLRNLRDDYAPVGELMRAAAWLFLAATLVLIIALGLRRRAPSLAWGLGVALCTLAPAAMITTELWQGFGRFLYLPAVGLAVVVCDVLSRSAALPERSHALIQRFVFFLAAWSGAMLLESTLGFSDDLTLYRRALAESPEQGWTHGSVGLALKRSGDCAAAVPMLERAAAMAPREPRYLDNLARCFLALGDREGALRAAQRGQSRFHDTSAEASFLLDEYLTQPADSARAAALLQRCVAIQPSHKACLAALANSRAAGSPQP